LNKGQELKLSALIKNGKGIEHSRFSPGLMFYKNIVRIKIERDCPREVIETCPQKILKMRDGRVVAENEFQCDMCEACI
jgi:hypothetical protein